MLTIRNFILDAVVLLGVAGGIAAGVSGYLHHLPDPPERVAAAGAPWSDPDTTGSIAPTAAAQTPWTDPPYHRLRW